MSCINCPLPLQVEGKLASVTSLGAAAMLNSPSARCVWWQPQPRGGGRGNKRRDTTCEAATHAGSSSPSNILGCSIDVVVAQLYDCWQTQPGRINDGYHAIFSFPGAGGHLGERHIPAPRKLLAPEVEPPLQAQGLWVEDMGKHLGLLKRLQGNGKRAFPSESKFHGQVVIRQEFEALDELNLLPCHLEVLLNHEGVLLLVILFFPCPSALCANSPPLTTARQQAGASKTNITVLRGAMIVHLALPNLLLCLPRRCALIFRSELLALEGNAHLEVHRILLYLPCP
mmetsp:Transcript_105436/g.263948  ORF Transcript_105436/g.263948 Transcript_105436/m.263948 type:complete len:285 (+) Transcript_105436:186-1040(+)